MFKPELERLIEFDASAAVALKAVRAHHTAMRRYDDWAEEVLSYTSRYNGCIDFAPLSKYRAAKELRPNLGTRSTSWYFHDLRGNKFWLQEVGGQPEVKLPSEEAETKMQRMVVSDWPRTLRGNSASHFDRNDATDALKKKVILVPRVHTLCRRELSAPSGDARENLSLVNKLRRRRNPTGLYEPSPRPLAILKHEARVLLARTLRRMEENNAEGNTENSSLEKNVDSALLTPPVLQ